MSWPYYGRHAPRPVLDVSPCTEMALKWSQYKRGIWKAVAIRALQCWKASLNANCRQMSYCSSKCSLSGVVCCDIWGTKGYMKLIMPRKLWTHWLSMERQWHISYTMYFSWVQLVPSAMIYIYWERSVAVQCHTLWNLRWGQPHVVSFIRFKRFLSCFLAVFPYTDMSSCMPVTPNTLVYCLVHVHLVHTLGHLKAQGNYQEMVPDHVGTEE